MTQRNRPDECPVCGAEVPDGAAACPECGSDERTGWSETARYDGLGLPDEAFDYDEFVGRELEGRAPRRRHARFWWVVAVVLLVAWVWVWFAIW
jgi:predicted nucleic acid-binding Zn ribbon protein